MKVVSSNIARPTPLLWRGKKVMTGIFKNPVEEGILLTPDGVSDDAVIDRRYHGGTDKAVYLYSADHYPYWQSQYPNLSWQWGMFGENLTIEDLDEHTLFPGDQFTLGSQVRIEISTPREPCYKLGLRFGDMSIVKAFAKRPFSGVYARVIEGGIVRAEDQICHVAQGDSSQSIAEIYTAKMSNKKVGD